MYSAFDYRPSNIDRRRVIKDQLLALELNFEQVHALLYVNSRWDEITCVQDAIRMGDNPQAHDFEPSVDADWMCAICSKEKPLHIIESKIVLQSRNPSAIDE